MRKKHLDILIEQAVNQQQLTKRQINWLNKHIKGSWEYKNCVVNVEGNVDLVNKNIKEIPFQFGIVSGDFMCYMNQLTSLKGCPSKVGDFFNCSQNNLTSLKFSPIEVADGFSCAFNQLTSLEYAPIIKSGYVWIVGNPYQLNDKLFENIKQISVNGKIGDTTLDHLREQIPIQFGITDEKIINKIWQSYMNILEGKSE